MKDGHVNRAGQAAIPATWMRGGTSKALFFLARDLPPPGDLRDRVIKRAMGCPHHLQIDGIGGGRGNTSKIAIVDISERDDADVDYCFAQVGIEADFIDYRATCGNISAAVGPFAIMKGLVAPIEPETTLRIYNSNIDDLLFQRIETKDGAPRIEGDFVNAGVPGSGAEVFTDFSRAAGRRTGHILPSGNARDLLRLESGLELEATLLDVGNPAAYVAAAALGLSGTESPGELLAHPTLLAIIGEIRRAAAIHMGLDGLFSVRVGLVAPPADYRAGGGAEVAADAIDLCARFFALDYCAPNYPGSASVSTGAAARLQGSVVHDFIPAHRRAERLLRIGHPGGIMEVVAEADGCQPDNFRIRQLGFGRTARALMDGVIFVPRAELEG